MCLASDDLLKKEETRREFRKIEQEALLDEHETGHFEKSNADSHSVKCEGIYFKKICRWSISWVSLLQKQSWTKWAICLKQILRILIKKVV